MKKAPAKPAKKTTKKPAFKKVSTPQSGPSLRAKLDAGAKKLQKLRQKKDVSPTTPAKKASIEVEVIPKIVECRDSIIEIRDRRVVMSKDGASLTLDPDTTPGEYIRLFDNAERGVELGGLILGDLINEGAKLKAFGSEGKYAAAMASTGRSVDSLKRFASVAKNTPPSLRNLSKQIKFEHLRAVVKVPKLEDKKALLLEVKETAESGKTMTVAVLKEKAEKYAPKRTVAPKAVIAERIKAQKRDMTVEESIQLEELVAHIAESATMVSAAAFVLEIGGDHTITLRENLERIARFSAQLKE